MSLCRCVFGANRKKEANKNAQQLLEEMELGEYQSKKPAVLSGGEKHSFIYFFLCQWHITK